MLPVATSLDSHCGARHVAIWRDLAGSGGKGMIERMSVLSLEGQMLAHAYVVENLAAMLSEITARRQT
jgi:hypothetical protein